MGTWKHIKLGELPQSYVLGFFCWGRFLKIYIEIKKRELFHTPLKKTILFFIPSLLSHFVKKKYFHGNMGTYTTRGAPVA